MNIAEAAEYFRVLGNEKVCDGDRHLVVDDQGNIQGGYGPFPLPEYRRIERYGRRSVKCGFTDIRHEVAA